MGQPVCTIALEDVSVMPRGDFSPPKGMKEIKPSSDKSYHIPLGNSEFVLTPDKTNNFDFSFPDRKIRWEDHKSDRHVWIEHLAIVRHYVGSPESVFVGDVDGDGTADVILMSAKYATVVQNRNDNHLDGAGCTPWQAWKKPLPLRQCDHTPGACDQWRRMDEPASTSSCDNDGSYDRKTPEGERIERECLEHQKVQLRAFESIAENKEIDPEDRVVTVCHMQDGTEEQTRAIISITSDSSVSYDGRHDAASCHHGSFGSELQTAYYFPILKDKKLATRDRLRTGVQIFEKTKEIDDVYLGMVKDRSNSQGDRLEAAERMGDRDHVLRDIAVNGAAMGFGLQYRLLACIALEGDDREVFQVLKNEVLRNKEMASMVRQVLQQRIKIPKCDRNERDPERDVVENVLYYLAAKTSKGKDQAHALWLIDIDRYGNSALGDAALALAERVLPQQDPDYLAYMKCKITGEECREPESDI